MYENKDKLKASRLIKELYKDKNSLSVTLTGSYSENFDIKKDLIKILNNKGFKNISEAVGTSSH